jgi:hypothetical protein
MDIWPQEVRDETLNTHLDWKDWVDGEEVDYVFGYACGGYVVEAA